MARRLKKKHAKTFQQRQTERRRVEAERDRADVEEMAAKFTCSNGVARDFAGQCEERIEDIDFDLLCSDLALDFWESPPAAAKPVVDLLRQLADERRRHQAALANLRERLLATTMDSSLHHHLDDHPIGYYQQKVRERLLYPDPGAPARPELRGFR